MASSVSSATPTAGGPARSKAAAAPPANGIAGAPALSRHAASAHDSPSIDQHAHDRLLFLVANFVGCTANVTLSTGERFSGLFSAPLLNSPEPKYALKMTRRLDQSAAESSYVGVGDHHLMLFDVRQVVDLDVANVSLDKLQARATNGASGAFRTDTDISGNLSRAERELTPWQPGAGTDVANVTFSSADRAWDQFEANRRLYGVETDYNEDLYTTKIDRSDPSYRKRLQDADRLAREIEGTATTNIHQAEERGLVDPGNRDVDEEERYSGVRRDLSPLAATNSSSAGQNRYTPPARRAPTGQPTVSGAPVDPAIISSQLARPQPQNKAAVPPNESSTTSKSAESTKENRPLQPSAEGDKSRPSPLDKVSLDKNTADKMAQNGHVNQPTSKNTLNTSKQPAVANAENATQTVARDVLKHFKDFSATEKMRMREAQRMQARKEKDVKLNDLKHWGLNFKLKNEVPSDMLGILAKDKQKQAEIVEKARRQAHEKQQAEVAARAAAAAAPPSSSSDSAPSAKPSAPAESTSTAAKPTPPATRNGSRNDKTANVPSVPSQRQPQPGNLGSRLKAHMHPNQQQQQQQQQQHQPLQQQQQQHQQRAPPTGPAGFDSSASRTSSHSATSSTLTRFNPAAFEFKPNPAAASFSPTPQTRPAPSASPAKSGPVPAKTASFFGDKRPAGPRRSIRDAFNPITRMKAEADKEEDAKKKSAVAANGGIPNAYITNPRWTTSPENEEKKHWDCFAKQLAHLQAPPPHQAASMPYADQIPAAVHPGSGPMPMAMPPQGPQQFQQQQQQQFVPAQAREHGFDGPRMHPSAYSSPRVQHQMVVHPSPMMAHTQPYAQPMQQFAMGGQPMYMRTPSQQFQGQHMATPMMPNHSGGAPYMAMPNPQAMPMYPPQFQFVPTQGPGGPAVYGSPRGAPMMVQQGSQQGQGPQFMMQGQPGQHMYMQHPQQQQQQQQMMRPGMQQQQQQSASSSFGSPHMMNQQFPPQPHRGNSFNGSHSFNGGQFAQQQQQQQQQPNNQAGQRPSSGHQPMPALPTGPAAAVAAAPVAAAKDNAK